MYINTNVSALNSLNKLTSNSASSSKVMEGLASGKRINTAADDAAGTAVSARMTSQIKGLAQAARNASDGIAMIQTFEGAMASQGDILQRMRELAVQSSNGTYSDADRTNLNAEFTQLSEEFNRIAEGTSFNGNKYIGAGNPTTDVKLQIADTADGTLTITFSASDIATVTGATTMTIGTQADAGTTIEAIDAGLDKLNSERAKLGGFVNRLEYTVDNVNNTKVNLTDARSRIEDVDMAEAMSELTKNEILTQSSVAMLGKANQAPQAILKLLQ